MENTDKEALNTISYLEHTMPNPNLHTIAKMRNSKKEMTAEQFNTLIGWEQLTEGENVLVYLNKFYITINPKGGFIIELAGHTKYCDFLQVAEDILWTEHARDF